MTANDAIRPFRIEVPEAELDDLRRRLAATRWPEPAAADPGDFSRGVPLGYLRDLAEYWGESFDWRAQEKRLNAVGQFTTEVDGQTIHFLHARSPEPAALPLLVLHGYPSSFVEFVDLIGPLVDPRAHGVDGPAFHVVVPSLPGFGWSTPVRAAGWEMGRTTDALATVMARLGYGRYAVHGGDIGAGIAGRLAATRPDRVVGSLIVSEPRSLGLAGEQFPIPDHLTDDERARVDVERARWQKERGYLDLQGNQPETIGAALTDSPVGQLAWIAEKFATWTNPASATPDEAVGRDALLTNVSVYWFTRSGASAARFLWESAHADLDWIAPSEVPTGWAVFQSEPIVRRFMDADRSFAFWADHSEGGHFPALEAPDLLVGDLRRFFGALR